MEEKLRAELVDVSHALHARGWVANHDGNLTARLGEGRFLATPTAVSKAQVRPENLIVVDDSGAVVAGTRKSFSEIKLHLAAYRARPDVACVVHAHPPTATGFAVAGVELGAPFMAEPVVSLGPKIPLVPFGMPGEPALDDALALALKSADVVMLANHGVLAVGPDLETCMLRIELLEHISKIALVARQLGGPVLLPTALVEQLTEKHNTVFPKKDSPSPVRSSVTSSESASALVASALERLR
ncbi:MAG: class II aldolase/adducin family protein [Myxococcota bacterium]|nr:class II aldolase/adducin family protein [Myxococcota bacterium]